eukprot:EC726773.1.p1 GENE.EC726773.1~~EC726773.1.p1  ORF type:complete len:135 (+),score=40.58 EC726773.1:64-468(+)
MEEDDVVQPDPQAKAASLKQQLKRTIEAAKLNQDQAAAAAGATAASPSAIAASIMQRRAQEAAAAQRQEQQRQLQQARRQAELQAQQSPAHYSSQDSRFGNFLIPIIPQIAPPPTQMQQQQQQPATVPSGMAQQ